MAFKKGHPGWNKGLKMGPSSRKGTTLPQETIDKMHTSIKNRGSNHYKWNGGKKLAIARHRNKRRNKGFILVTNNIPYDEPIHYHHIHPDLPYVVPCPARIHSMFFGADITHFNNVNLMIGIKVPDELLSIVPIKITKTHDELDYELYLKKLRKQEYQSTYRKQAMRYIQFTETVAENIMLLEQIYYNVNTGHPTVSSRFIFRQHQATINILTSPEAPEDQKDFAEEYYPETTEAPK
jgi:hypothetical protein